MKEYGRQNMLFIYTNLRERLKKKKKEEEEKEEKR